MNNALLMDLRLYLLRPGELLSLSLDVFGDVCFQSIFHHYELSLFQVIKSSLQNFLHFSLSFNLVFPMPKPHVCVVRVVSLHVVSK